MENNEFYIEKYYIFDSNNIDSLKIPSCTRRMSTVDKTALSLLLELYDDKIEEIVYSSAFGEIERLNSLIEEYQTYNEVSPAKFSGSVHNFAAGCLCQIKKTSIPYSAISSMTESVCAGLVKSVISKKRVLYCYCDCIDTPIGLSLIVSKTKTPNAIKCEMENTNSLNNENEFEGFCKFLKGYEDIFTSAACKIKRIKQ